MKRILIAGGGMNNKGAQAMLYTVLYELRNRYPDCKIYVAMSESISTTLDLKAEVIALRPMSWMFLLGGIKTAKAMVVDFYYASRELLSHIIHRDKVKRSMNRLSALKKEMKKIDVMLDISGYSLSSSCGLFQTQIFLDRLQVMKKYGIKTYLLPQSFGPFDYTDKRILRRITDTLSYPSVIWARESVSQDYLRKIGVYSNVKLSKDIVLLSKAIDYHMVLENTEEIRNIDMPRKTVVIIPNMNVSRITRNNKTLSSVISLCIDKLRNEGFSILLLWHSGEDEPIVMDIKAEYKDDAAVLVLDRAVSCIEFIEYIKQASFCIASRYHSIVQSYKHCVPCIAFGWAEKYQELLSYFDQEKYNFDMTESIANEKVVLALKHMMENYHEESDKIRELLLRYQAESIFSDLVI